MTTAKMPGMVRALRLKLMFVASFSVAVLGIVTLAPITPHTSSDPARCFNVFVNALKTKTATGTWACMDEPMKRGYFSIGWNGDADVQKHYFDPFVVKSQALNVSVYANNPIRICAPDLTGVQICKNVYLVHFEVINPDGTVDTRCSVSGCAPAEVTYAITLDKQGLIGDISLG